MAKKPTSKKNYTTVGTIKSLNLSGRTFTLEPISKYRFEVKDDDESSWKIIFKEKSVIENVDPTSLQLIPQDAKFIFNGALISAMIVLKQSKSKIKVVVEETQLNNFSGAKSGANDANTAPAEAENADEEKKDIQINVVTLEVL